MTHITPFAYCSSCGTRYPDDGGWPRACANCGRVTYRNPLPVAVVIVPIGPAGEGVLLVRRAVAPHIGQLALPGGYVNYGETWQAAGAREVAEETGVLLDPATIRAGGVGRSPMRASEVTLLPQPDSPTMHRVLPLLTEKDTSSTTFTPLGAPSKRTESPFTSSRGAPATNPTLPGSRMSVIDCCAASSPMETLILGVFKICLF